jgi:HAE1 family hydrophobic/amphiphilic exporter-1
MNIPEFSVNRKVTVLMMILIVILFGVISFFNLGLDLMPELEFPIVSVVTTYEGVASEDIETLITRPIESVVSTIKHVKTVSSFSHEGLSAVMIQLEWGTNLDFAAQDVREKVALAEDYIPEDADRPLIMKLNVTDWPVIYFGVTGLEDTRTLRKYLDDNVRPRLERLEGVASAILLGGLEREINVLIDRQKLKAYNLSLNQVVSVLASENLNVSGGHLIQEEREYLVRTFGEFKDLNTIRNTILATNKGGAVYIKDIAQVKDTHEDIRNYARTNNQDCVILAIMKQSGANTVSVIDRVHVALKDIRREIPRDIKFYPMMDQGNEIKKVVKRTAGNALIGGILAIAFILFFLRNWQPSLVIALAIPLSIITSFIGLYVFRYTFNIMTLAGLALGVGMLVDNAVVVIENTYRHLEEGRSREDAAKLGASEVGMAITASTLTTMAVFLPMTLASGIAGKLARPLALTVCLSLFASLFVAITLVPMMGSVMIKVRGRGEGKEGSGFKAVERRYGRILLWALMNRKKVLAGTLFLFLSSLFCIRYMGTEFMPKSDTTVILAMLKMPVGTSLDETEKVVQGLEEIIMDQPEVKFVSSFTGLSKLSKMDVAWGTGNTGVNESQIFAPLVDKDKRTRSSQEITEAIRSKIPRIKGATIDFMDMGQMLLNVGGETATIAIKVFGKDLDQLEALSQRMEKRCRDIDGIRDLEISLKRGRPELQINIDREKASKMGLSVGQVARAVKTALLGEVATRYRVHGDEYDIRVKFREEDRQSLSDIRHIGIASPFGFHVPLYQVARMEYGEGPVRITRENQERKVTVSANTHGRDLGSIIRDIKQRISGLNLPMGYFIEYGGSYEEMQNAFISLLKALVVAIILVYMIMAAQFESLLQPFIIMFTIPLAIIGAIFGLLIFGKTLSVPSFMGIIILAGIVVNNAIVMIDYVNRLRHKGVEPQRALIQGAQVRLRPVLITAFTTIIGMIPMALSQTEGAEMRSPMAIAVAFGLLSSTLLTLFIIPIAYSIAGRLSYRHGTDAPELQ